MEHLMLSASLGHVLRNNSLRLIMSAIAMISESIHPLLPKISSVASSTDLVWMLVGTAGSQGHCRACES